jgi:hypothetical protein
MDPRSIAQQATQGGPFLAFPVTCSAATHANTHRHTVSVQKGCDIWWLALDRHRTATGSVEWLPDAEGMSSLVRAAAFASSKL